jgi:hypothetical protein
MATPFQRSPELSLSHMRLVSEFLFLLNLCFIFVGYFGWVQGLQNEFDFFAVNFLVSIQWYSCLIEQCHCSWSILKGQLIIQLTRLPHILQRLKISNRRTSMQSALPVDRVLRNRSRRGGKLVHLLQQVCRMLEPWLLYKSALMPIRQ